MLMCLAKTIFVVAVLSANGVGSGLAMLNAPQLLLSVYYESNCPDSKQFVLKQLKPAMQLLHKHVTLRFVPFGKSTSIDYGFDGFVCHHGPEECLGNMMQDCALYQMLTNTDLEKLDYVACELDTKAGVAGDLVCVERAKLPVERIKKCVESEEGTHLQVGSEYLTNLVNPKFIPTITINEKYNQQIQDFGLRDLIGVLCQMLKDTVACSQYYNSLALQSILDTPQIFEPALYLH